MKKNFIFLLLIFLPFSIFSQAKIKKGKIVYLQAMNTSTNTSQRMITLFWDNDCSMADMKGIQSDEPKQSPKETREEKEVGREINEQGNEVIKKNIRVPTKNIRKEDWFKDKFSLFKDFKKKELYSPNFFITIKGIEAAVNGGDVEVEAQPLVVKEKLPDFAWQITQEKKKIEGYECFKAISKPFRGRTYIAWFCPEIPISDGPWKLWGLPGLILEAQDEKGEVKFVAQKVELQTENFKVENKLLTTGYPVLTWEEFKNKYQEEHNKRKNYYKSKGITLGDSKMKLELEDLED
ncbi:MAG: GLPGLI family protein [Raineya sp.]|nr:GLPGLI family protein [Raineya sp.]